MKLLVAAAALDLWGPDHRFRTPVFLEGRLDGRGRAIGNLVLAGRGDPNPERRLYDPEVKDLPIQESSPFIEGIADQLEERGIRRVEGDIVADTTYFLDEPHGGDWEQEDMFWHYGAPSSALAVFENVFRVSLSPGKATGEPALLEVTPPQESPEVVNRVGTGPPGGKPDIRIGADRSGLRVTLLGSLPLNRPTLTYGLAVSEPALNAARTLKTSLERRGIPVSGQPRVRALQPIEVLEEGKVSLEKVRERQRGYREQQELASWQSLPLIDNLRILIKSSRNLYGEMLLRGLGAQVSGVGSLQTGLQALEAFLEKAGIADEPLDFSDGSGLSRTNLLTPEAVVRLLQYMERHPQAAGFPGLPAGRRPGRNPEGTHEGHRRRRPGAGQDRHPEIRVLSRRLRHRPGRNPHGVFHHGQQHPHAPPGRRAGPSTPSARSWPGLAGNHRRPPGRRRNGPEYGLLKRNPGKQEELSTKRHEGPIRVIHKRKRRTTNGHE